MEKITFILEALKEYDLFNLAVVGVGYMFIHKKISIVDKAVNQRAEGSPTISDDITEIKGELKLMRVDLTHVKEEVDLHREVDESAFLRIENDIRLINSKI